MASNCARTILLALVATAAVAETHLEKQFSKDDGVRSTFSGSVEAGDCYLNFEQTDSTQCRMSGPGCCVGPNL